MQNSKIYDIIVIGGGPGGYTSALYAARAGLSVAVFERLSAGGQLGQTQTVDNYPGFDVGVDGYELAEKMKRQAERFGAESVFTSVTGVVLDGKIKKITTDKGEYLSKAVLIATGADPKRLGVPGEDRLRGRGVAYCATCDGMFYKNKAVVVVGGGNTAAEDALLLGRIAKKVYLVHRRDTLRASKVYHAPIESAENIEFLRSFTVDEIVGSERVVGVRLVSTKTQEVREIECDGVFVSVGRNPATELFKSKLETDSSGYIVAGETCESSVPGVFAVGDVRTKELRQIVTAVSDGAVAAHMAEKFLTEVT